MPDEACQNFYHKIRVFDAKAQLLKLIVCREIYLVKCRQQDQFPIING